MSGALLALPATRQPGALTYVEPQPADIEFIVQWAIARTGLLPWSRDRDRELAFDKGYTAKPRRRPPVTWTLAEACAGLTFDNARPLPARLTPDDDTQRVIDAIKRLPPKTAATIIACARANIRPEWRVEGKSEPELVKSAGYGQKKKKGKHWKRVGRLRIIETWQPSREAICAARAVYTLWHDGLLQLSYHLSGQLSRWQTNGLAAPERPWETPLQKTA